MLKNKNSCKAFTLIELSVAVLIIAVLTVIAIPAYLTHLEEAKGSKALETLSLIRTAQMLYLPEYAVYTNDIATLQTYTNFSLSDDDWTYQIVSPDNASFTATATRTSPNPNYDGKTITIDQSSDIVIDGTRVIHGGSWPP